MPTLADAGLPLIILFLPAAVLLFVPIALVEAAIYRALLERRFVACLGVSLLGNLLSTVLGVPLAWGLVFVVQLLGVGELAWVGPEGHASEIPLATLVFLVPAFGLSVWLEGWIARAKWEKDLPRRAVWRAALIANGATYACMFAFVGYNLVMSLL